MPAEIYNPSCCTIGMSQSNLVWEMDGDVSNEEPILAPAAACLRHCVDFCPKCIDDCGQEIVGDPPPMQLCHGSVHMLL